jgi:hypothetical protein
MYSSIFQTSSRKGPRPHVQREYEQLPNEAEIGHTHYSDGGDNFHDVIGLHHIGIPYPPCKMYVHRSDHSQAQANAHSEPQ